MIDFDISLKSYCDDHGGVYNRYSDDIMMILPGSDAEALGARDFAVAEIRKHGNKLFIKDSKTSVVVYEESSNGQNFRHVAGAQGRNGLEYLGFRLDGRHIYIRDATISRLYRKIAGAIKAECATLIKRYPGKGATFLLTRFDYSRFFKRYGRVDDFDPADYSTWTFWTYARKAMKAFGTAGRPIPRQLRNYKMVVRTRVEKEIVRQLAKHI